MATATLTIADNLDTGEVDIQGNLSDLPTEDALPTGAQIMFAYMSQHMLQISEQAQDWFRSGMLKNLADANEVVIHD